MMQTPLHEAPTGAQEPAPAQRDAVAAWPSPPTWVAAGLVLLAAVLAYATALGNGFAFDDVPIIRDNPTVHTLDDPGQLWTTSYWPVAGTVLGLYRPLTTFLFAVQWVLGGGDALLFHAINVALHAVNSLLVLGLLLTLVGVSGGAGLWAATVGAAIFAVHPVHTEAVANIVGQAELVAAMAVLSACWLHAARPPGARVGPARIAALIGLYLFGMAAKEHAIVLPALLVALDFAQGRARLSRGQLGVYAREVVLLIAGLAAAAVLFLLARQAVLGSIIGADANPAFPYLSGESRIWNALRAWPEFYRLLVFPQDLSADYSPGVILPVEHPTPMALAGGMLLLLTILLAFFVLSGSLAGLAAAWLLVAILPVSNLLFPIGVLVAERALYLPSVAVSMAAVAGALLLLASPSSDRRIRTAAIAAAAILTLLGIRTAVRNPVWMSTDSVQESVIRSHPESYRAQWNAAVEALREGDGARAEYHFLLGYRIYGEDAVFVSQLGNFYLGRGDFAVALRYLQEARALYPEFPRAQIYSAYVFNRTGRPDSALVLLDQIRPGSPDMMVNRNTIEFEKGRALDALGRHDEAVAIWTTYVPRAGQNAWLYHALRARSLAWGGRPLLARDALADAVAAAHDERGRAATDSLGDLMTSDCLASRACDADPLAGIVGW